MFGVLLVFYLVLLLIKLAWMSLHTRWVLKYGPAYRSRLDSLYTAANSQTAQYNYDDLIDAIRSCNSSGTADLPFPGLKEFQLRALVEKVKQSGVVLRRTRLLGLRAILVITDFVFLSIFGGTLIVLLSWMPHRTQGVSTLGNIAAFLLLAGGLLLAADAVAQYARAGMYSATLHTTLSYLNDPGYSRFIDEFKVLAGTALCVLFNDAAAIATLARTGFDFGDPALSRDRAIAYFDSAYHASMTFIFSTQLLPVDLGAKAVVLLISLQAVGIVLLAVAGLLEANTPSQRS